MHKAEEITFSEKVGKVSGLLILPKGAQAVLVLAHGAGAGMRHRFMEETAQKLADHGIATFRYQFPYMEKASKRPDREAVLTTSVRAAITAAKKHADGLPLFAGGKSMGGRMTSLAAAKEPLEGVRGLIYFGFPLHAAGKPSVNRGDHLFDTLANAIPAGIPGCFSRSQTFETALCSSRQKGRAFCH
jgi:uncharacterized protein